MSKTKTIETNTVGPKTIKTKTIKTKPSVVRSVASFSVGVKTVVTSHGLVNGMDRYGGSLRDYRP